MLTIETNYYQQISMLLWLKNTQQKNIGEVLQ